MCLCPPGPLALLFVLGHLFCMCRLAADQEVPVLSTFSFHFCFHESLSVFYLVSHLVVLCAGNAGNLELGE